MDYRKIVKRGRGLQSERDFDRNETSETPELMNSDCFTKKKQQRSHGHSQLQR